MKEIEIYSPAKINLFLNISGFNEKKKLHTLTAYNQTIDMYDIITIYERKKLFDGIQVIIDDNISNDLNNSAYVAANLFFKYTGINPNSFFIKIKKGIPVGYGLGGESTDAASVLVGLNEYYYTNLSNNELLFLASKVGSDVPYFINGGYAKVSDTGNEVAQLKECYYNNFIVIMPNFSLSTKDMYRKLDEFAFIKKEYLNNTLYNDFVKVMPQELIKLREFLNKYDNINHSLTGSGSAYYIASHELFHNPLIINDIKKNFPDFKIRNYKKVKSRKLIKISKNLFI